VSNSTTDSDLRDRAILRVNAMNNTNEDAIRLALRDIGITDVTMKRDMYGFGTIGIIVRINNSPKISLTTANTLNNIVTNICPGARIVVPEYMAVQLVLNVEFANINQIDSTKTSIYNNIVTYFNNLGPGDSLRPDNISQTIQSVNNVTSVDIRCIFIDGRKAVVGTQTALSDQNFVLASDAPITYTEV
jgi:uncharacterized phage protein gp47/JayE